MAQHALLNPTVHTLPVDAMPFTGFRLADGDRTHSPAPVFLSLRHWFEAEKFRTCERDLFDSVLVQPTLKEVIKLAKRERTRWRMDWEAVRCRALACGMVYASRAEPGAQRWAASEQELATMLQPLKLPEKFNAEAAREFVRLRQAPRVAVLFLDAENTPRDLVGKKLNLLHRRHGNAWNLVHWCGRHTSWQVHDWAVKQMVPVQYLGTDGARLAETDMASLAKAADTVIVFEEKGGKKMDRILRALRGQRACTVELELYEPGRKGAELVPR